MADDNNKKSWLKALSFNSNKLDVDGFGLRARDLNNESSFKQEDNDQSPTGSPNSSKNWFRHSAPGFGAPYSRYSTDSRGGRESCDEGRSMSGAGRDSMDRTFSMGGEPRVKRDRSFDKLDLEHSYSMWSSA